ncbi:MAG TPA: hypothetical protein VL181_08680, partial [Holophagaceae bacterium]|nr:hypothetical protein [Holophagaceae bacterium]
SGGAIMSWKLVPDDTTVVANSSQNNVMHGLGFSTSSPAIARVDTNSGTPKDLLFIGGGLSTSALDASLAPSYTSPSITKFGRSLIAFDVVNGPGTSLYTWNFNDSAFTTKFGSMGCIPAATVPTDLVPGRGRAWRVYFSDTPTDANATATTPRGAGVWALGDTALFQTTDGASVGNVIREDSSNIDVWAGGATVNTTAGIRHILQTPTGYSITTPPAVFLLGNPSVYPAFRSAAPKTAPATVALAFGTGDRNDPTDQDSIDPGSANQNYLDVIFDRNDSGSLSGVAKVVTTNLDTAGMSQSTDLADLTSVSSLTDTNIVGAPYYLTQYLGYKLKMGAATAQPTSGKFYYPKVITSATVLNGVLFFSDFLPGQGNSSACTGTGTTNTYRICDVMRPVFNGGNTVASSTTFNSGSASCSGIVLTFPNLPGEITSLGTTSIIQTGQGTSSTGGGDSNTINNTGANVGSGSANPNARTFKPRAWRVVR